ncbi:MAG: TetR/AcrR family transcriptional regulator [Balneolaceae bacterium]
MSLRNQILEVSRSMLVEEGFSSLSMRKIARKIDVSATSIYLHFKNKDHLLLTLIEESVEELNREIFKLAESDSDTLEKITRIARGYVNFGLTQPQIYEVIFMLRPEEMPRYPKEKFRKARSGYEVLASVIREGVVANEIVEEDPLMAAYTIWAQLHGVISVILNRRLDTRISENEFIDHAIEHIVEGFLVSKSPA